MGQLTGTAGPSRPEYNYMLPAAARLPEAARIIAQQGYFVMHLQQHF